MHFPEILSSGGRPVQTLTDCLNRNGLIGYVTRVFPLGKLPIEERAEEPITAIDHAVKEAIERMDSLPIDVHQARS
jgi:hypothetical protein